jgi:hypothetical protein
MGRSLQRKKQWNSCRKNSESFPIMAMSRDDGDFGDRRAMRASPRPAFSIFCCKQTYFHD